MAILYRNKCDACGRWTIYEATTDTIPIRSECTSCGAGYATFASVSEMKKTISEIEAGIKMLEQAYPRLRWLRDRGQSITLLGRDES